MMKLGGTLLGKLELDPKLRELCLLHAVKLVGGDYEWVQHVPIARDLGCSDAQIAALGKGDDGAACFDAPDQPEVARPGRRDAGAEDTGAQLLHDADPEATAPARVGPRDVRRSRSSARRQQPGSFRGNR